MSSSSFNEWIHVQTNIDRIIEGAAEPFHPGTIGNVRDLIDLLWGRFAIPEVGEGDWNTICLDWQTTHGGPLRIEVFSDRMEVYHLEPAFDVWCEPHQPGQFFSSKFITTVPSPITIYADIPLSEIG
jgi:hypothetical protein